MKKIILILSIALSLAACRMNNGDIGDFFGSWLLYSMTVDGTDPSDFNNEETFWEFQNNIIEISQVDDRYEKQGRWGTWVDNDNTLILDWTHSENNDAPGTGSYKAPEWLYMPANRKISLHFVERKSNRMTLDWTDDEGRHITYYLRKIW